MKFLSEIDWEGRNWLNQLLFYFVGCYLCFSSLLEGTGRDSGWYYFVIASFLLVVHSFNIMLGKGGFRYFLSLFVVLVNTFVVPISFFTYGVSVQTAAAASLIYVIIVFAISPLPVGGMVLITAIFFACYQKYYYTDIYNTSVSDLLMIIVFYIAAALIAFCWRLLITRMYEVLVIATEKASQVSEKEVDSLKQELDAVKNEERLLKEEIALHILEMNTIGKLKNQ